MKRKTILFISILQLLVITGCYDDLGNYDYTNSTKVSFVNSASSDYTFMVGDLFEMDAPINFSTDIGNVDELFPARDVHIIEVLIWFESGSRHIATGNVQ